MHFITKLSDKIHAFWLVFRYLLLASRKTLLKGLEYGPAFASGVGLASAAQTRYGVANGVCASRA